MLVWLQKSKRKSNGYIWNAATFSSNNGEYLASTIDDSVITWDEIINTADNLLTNLSWTMSMNATNIA